MHVVIRMARYRYAAFLGRVFILTMTAFGSDSLPTIPLDHGNKLPNLHNQTTSCAAKKVVLFQLTDDIAKTVMVAIEEICPIF